ncbi:hypothetical protein D3C78_434110 [compost metagenome]
MAVAFGGMGKRGSTRGDLFAGIAIDTVSWHCRKAFHQRLAVEPVGEEGADHGIAHCKFRHAATHCRDHTGTVSHGDARLARAPHAADHGKIVIVERVGVQTNGNLAKLGCGRLAGADLNLVVTTARLDINSLAGHANLLVGSGK